MTSILNWFKGLSTLFKIIVVVAILALGLFILDKTTGAVSNFKSRLFDKNEAATMKKVDDLEKENISLRQQKKDLEQKAIEAEAKNAVLEKQAQEIGGKIKTEEQNLNKALEEAKKEAEITNQETDAFTRCVRLKSKLLDSGIKSASEINCEDFR